jgi:AcrR family transcriptional regulator
VIESTSTRAAKPERGNREKLLRAAIVCLRDKGYAATTARDLVAVSGANLASIGYHFGGKEALLNEAVAEATRAWAKSIEDEAFSGPPADREEHLRRALSASADRYDELEPYLRSFVEAFPPALRSPELRGAMAAAYADVRAAGEAMLERILEDADVEPEHIRTLSTMIVAMSDGLILQWLLDPGATPRSGEMIDALRSVAAFASDGNAPGSRRTTGKDGR